VPTKVPTVVVPTAGIAVQKAAVALGVPFKLTVKVKVPTESPGHGAGELCVQAKRSAQLRQRSVRRKLMLA
jgi:hypothetical protein